LQNLVEDLLITLNMPEWPAAEVLLQLLCKSLIGALLNKKAANTNSNDELRLLSIQLLGMIASRVRQDARIAKENTVFQAPPKRVLDTDEIVEENEDSSCICGTGYGNVSVE
jgi:cohesin loading factor subunit SCC2